MPSDRAVAFIRSTNPSTEPASHRARTAAMLFADGQQQRLQRRPFGQLLSGRDGHNGLALSGPAVGVGDISVGQVPPSDLTSRHGVDSAWGELGEWL